MGFTVDRHEQVTLNIVLIFSITLLQITKKINTASIFFYIPYIP